MYVCDEAVCSAGEGVPGALDLNWSALLPLSSLPEIVHEDLKMGSDGESDQASATSSDEVQSPVRVRMRNHPPRKISTEVLNPVWLVVGREKRVEPGKVALMVFPPVLPTRTSTSACHSQPTSGCLRATLRS